MFPHQIRYSSRAKYVSLRIRADQGLEVVLPHGVSSDCIPDLLRKKQAWIRRHLRSSEPRPGANETLRIPRYLDFCAINERLDIAVQPRTSNGEIWYRPQCDGRLTIEGDISDPNFVIEGLIDWLKKAAHHRLLPVLEELSSQHNLPFSRLSIRDQKTRWGSCSTRGNINLNLRLLFMPPRLCHHIMLHELGHTVHMNHSPGFWALLESMDPQTQQHKAEIKQVRERLPRWLGGMADYAAWAGEGEGEGTY